MTKRKTMGESSYIEESLKQEIDAKISGGYFDPLDRLMDFLGKNMEAKCMEELAELIKAISKISVGGYNNAGAVDSTRTITITLTIQLNILLWL